MNKYMKISTSVLFLAVTLLTGCSGNKVPEVVDTTSIIVLNNGEVISYLVDEFDKEYYDISDLTSMAVEEAADYNTAHQEGEVVPVTAGKVEALEDGSGKVVVSYKYNSAETFEDYNDAVLFYGTVGQAQERGYNLDVILKSVKDDTLLSQEQLLQSKEKHLIITSEKAAVYCPAKVTHVSEEALLNENGSVDTTQTEDVTVILMK